MKWYSTLMVTMMFFLCSAQTFAQHRPGAAWSQHAAPLGKFLDPNGRLHLPKDFHGNLNPRGWGLAPSEKFGVPRFTPVLPQSIPADTAWDNQFVLEDLSGPVWTIAVAGSDIYVGGIFSVAGGITVNNVAKWNGTHWTPLGTGTNGAVISLAVKDNTVYAGGYFTQAGGNGANFVAKWDGSGWSALGSGMDGPVYALAVLGNVLYAGGSFTTAGGGSANNIAQWDDVNWSGLGAGMDGYVTGLAVSPDGVYACGLFTMADATPAQCIALWSGSNWSSLGGGLDDIVNAIVVDGNNVYVGGNFNFAGAAIAHHVAEWNGTEWLGLGDGVSGPDFITTVNALAVSGGTVYAGGYFTQAGAASARNMAQWKDGVWSGMGAGMDTPVFALAGSGDNIFAGGTFTKADGTPANRIAQWNGAWSGVRENLANGLNAAVYGLASSNSGLYAAGEFTEAGGTPAAYLSRWNGLNWSDLGAALNGRAFAVNATNGVLTVGGEFTSVAGISINRIARTNNSSWWNLGAGLNGPVYAIAVSGDSVFAGGAFDSAGNVPANHIALWNGVQWSALGDGMDDMVDAIAIVGNTVYASGPFVFPNPYLSAWNGTQWSQVGTGVDGRVAALAVHGNTLYAGGEFIHAGGASANHIAAWDGAGWSALGSGTDSTVLSLTPFGNTLYAGGYFSTAGGNTAASIARWDGVEWSGLGSGTDDYVGALTVWNGKLYAGGGFTYAGGKPSVNIADWTIASSPIAWTPILIGFPTFLSVSVPSPNVFWAGGVGTGFTTNANGFFISSSVDHSGQFDIGNIFGVNNKLAFACATANNGSSDARIYRTNDGGFNWSLVYQNTGSGAYMDGMFMFDTSRGIALGDPVGGAWELFSTADGGQSWTPLPVLPAAPGGFGWNNSLTFSDTLHGWFGTNSSMIYRTKDGGQSWQSAPFPFTNAIHIAFQDSLSGMASDDTGRVAVTIDGGTTWTRKRDPGDAGAVRLTVPRYTAARWLSANAGTVWGTSNMGASWNAEHIGSSAINDIANAIDTVSGQIVYYAVGVDGNILRGIQRIPPASVAYTYSLPSGWNLLSLPVIAANLHVPALFPQATSQLYGYQSGYRTQDSLVPGMGYWLKFSGAQAPIVNGIPALEYSVPVASGWNIIGSLSHSIAVNSITSSPASIVTSQFFSYNGTSYASADSIQPGKGYWVKVSQPGTLILAEPGGSAKTAAGRIRIVPNAEQPPSPPGVQVHGTASASSIPHEYALGQNYPNPFNPTTQISFDLPEKSQLTVTLYNVLGKEVASLVNSQTYEAGRYNIAFNASDYASGVYFYRLTAIGMKTAGRIFSSQKKMLLVK